MLSHYEGSCHSKKLTEKRIRRRFANGNDCTRYESNDFGIDILVKCFIYLKIGLNIPCMKILYYENLGVN